VPPQALAGPAIDADAPFLDEGGQPTRALLRSALEATIAARLPDREISPEEIEQATDAAWRLRQAQLAMRALAETPESAEERRRLRDEIASANADFAYAMGMTPGEFTAQVQSEVGVDSSSEGEAVPEPEFLDERP
jgi:hypothetical protein